MHALLIAMMLFVRAATSATAAGLPTATEAPRAADLLRAKRMADEAAARLETRTPARGGWVRGGGGWERGGAPGRTLPAPVRVR